MTVARGAIFRFASRALKMGAPEIPRGRFEANRSVLAIRGTRLGPPGRPGEVDFPRSGPSGRAGPGLLGWGRNGPELSISQQPGSNRTPLDLN